MIVADEYEKIFAQIDSIPSTLISYDEQTKEEKPF